MDAPRLSRRALIGTGSAGLAAAATTSTAITASAASAGSAAAAPTNILLLTCDDLSASTPSSFGGRPGLTPNIDALAAQGTSFDRAHVPVAICQPSRSAVMTGRLPHRNGDDGYAPIRPEVPVITDLLRQRGYRCGILNKTDEVDPVSRFGWETQVSFGELGAGRNPSRYGTSAATFFAQAKQERRPFFLVVNISDPHRPFYGSADEQAQFNAETLATTSPPSRVYDAASTRVPGFLPDLPEVRTELAQYESSARRADDSVGAVLRALTAAGLDSTTMVALFGDNSMGFPFAKAGCYPHGTRTPLVVRWPGTALAGRRESTAFVSSMDLYPTMVRAAGGAAQSGLDGRDLTPLLQGGTQSGRTTVHTMFGTTGSGARYDMRGTLTSRWSYVWNPWSDGTRSFYVVYMLGMAWKAMVAAGASNPAIKARTDLFLKRVPEELYDLSVDPHCLKNLIPAGGGAPTTSAARTALPVLRRSTAAFLQTTADPLHPAYVAAFPGA